MPVGTPVDVSSSRNILGTFKQTGWRCSSRQFCYCVIGGVDVARRIGVLAPDHLAVRLLIVLPLSPPYRRPVDRSQASRLTPPRSGLERSDFVHWPTTSVRRNAMMCRQSLGNLTLETPNNRRA